VPLIVYQNHTFLRGAFVRAIYVQELLRPRQDGTYIIRDGNQPDVVTLRLFDTRRSFFDGIDALLVVFFCSAMFISLLCIICK
jgi:hypothetical protein